MEYAVVLPGQGSQRNGMGEDFVRQYSRAREVFEAASESLGLDLLQICHGDDPRLDLTEFAQPAIVTAEIAMLTVLRESFSLSVRYWAGHSLGEYAALVGAGAIPLPTALRLVHLRGKLMQAAVPVDQGAMIAVIQAELNHAWVQQVAQEHGIDVANYNSPHQLVLSGSKKGVEAAGAVLEQVVVEKGGRVVPLNVSAPFHSQLMRSMEPTYREALEQQRDQFDARQAQGVASNYLGCFHDGTAAGLIDALAKQVSAPVRWIDNMLTIVAVAEGRMLEVGPKKPLRRFFNDLGHDVPAIISVRSAKRVLN